MKTNDKIKTVEVNGFRIEISKAHDSYNGIIYQGDNLIGAVAVGLHEGVDKLIDKAKNKIAKHI